MRAYLLFLPSTLLGVVGLVILYFRPLALEPRVGVAMSLVAAFALTGFFFIAAWLLERVSPSFRYAEKLLQRALARVYITLPLAFVFAALSALAEELFFRAALLPLIGVWGQAALFGLLHPAPRKAWVYTLFTFVAGLGLGYLTLFTGRLYPAVLVHFAVNLQGFLELRRKRGHKD